MRNIIITGGDDGLGKAIAKLLSEKNNIITISKTKENAMRISKEILSAECYACDITKPDEVDKTIKTIIENQGDIDILINNAGVWLAGDLTENSYEQISNCIDVNTKGPIYMTKAILPNMYEQGKGLIINVCSQASFDSDDFSTVYNASKWAMRGFNRSIQKDVSKKGIKVTGFYPGFMQTNIFKKAGNDYDTSTGLEVEKVARVIEFIIDCDEDVIIPEFGIKDIENY
ncbi:MAG: SDR family NAD(P)-dependent oxidoreductase [Bacilli bacterium]|nr:SDR family NAD(P)-dependent oxidoreductase [Bacilli bacterium]